MTDEYPTFRVESTGDGLVLIPEFSADDLPADPYVRYGALRKYRLEPTDSDREAFLLGKYAADFTEGKRYEFYHAMELTGGTSHELREAFEKDLAAARMDGRE